MNTAEPNPAAPGLAAHKPASHDRPGQTLTDGLTIFDDVHEVPNEPATFVGLQLMAVILSYSLALGILVLVLVPVVLVLTLLLPYLPQMLLPGPAAL